MIGNSGTGFSQNIWLRNIYIVSAKYDQAVYAKGKTQGSQKTDPVGCRLNERLHSAGSIVLTIQSGQNTPNT